MYVILPLTIWVQAALATTALWVVQEGDIFEEARDALGLPNYDLITTLNPGLTPSLIIPDKTFNVPYTTPLYQGATWRTSDGTYLELARSTSEKPPLKTPSTPAHKVAASKSTFSVLASPAVSVSRVATDFCDELEQHLIVYVGTPFSKFYYREGGHALEVTIKSKQSCRIGKGGFLFESCSNDITELWTRHGSAGKYEDDCLAIQIADKHVSQLKEGWQVQ